MLPFLKARPQTGIIISQRKPDVTPDMDDQQDDPNAGVDAASDDLINAIHAKDKKAVSAALKAAFEILDSQPHDEGEDTNTEPQSGAI